MTEAAPATAFEPAVDRDQGGGGDGFGAVDTAHGAAGGGMGPIAGLATGRGASHAAPVPPAAPPAASSPGPPDAASGGGISALRRAAAVRRSGDEPGAVAAPPSPAAAPAPAADAAGQPQDLGAEMDADVDSIAQAMKKQVLVAAGEREVVAVIRRWAGTPQFDRFITKLKIRTLVRATARSLFHDTTVNLFDTLFTELEDDRLAEFQQLLATSKAFAGAKPESGPSENGAATIGRQELIGLFGMMKGLSSGLAGVGDVAAWAAVKQANAFLAPLGVTIKDPAKLAEWVEKQLDVSGDFVFDGDFTGGEKLLGGENAASIGTFGGKVIWQLVMMHGGSGAGSVAKEAATEVPGLVPAAAKLLPGAMKAHDAIAAFKGVDDAMTSMGQYLLRMEEAGKLDRDHLLADDEFKVEAFALAGALTGAVGTATGLGGKEFAASLQSAMSKLGTLFKAGDVGAKLGRISQVLMDDSLTPEQQTKNVDEVVKSLITEATSIVGGKAAHHDAAHEEHLQKQLKEVAPDAAKKEAGEQARPQAEKKAEPALEKTPAEKASPAVDADAGDGAAKVGGPAEASGQAAPAAKSPAGDDVNAKVDEYNGLYDTDVRRGAWKKFAQEEIERRARPDDSGDKRPPFDPSRASRGRVKKGSAKADKSAGLMPATSTPGKLPPGWEEARGGPAMNPLQTLSDKQLAAVAATGKTPRRLKAELEHKIPQRVGRTMVKAGVPPEVASKVTKQTDIANFEPASSETHSVMDMKRHGNRSLPHALDDRDVSPLRSASDEDLVKIMDALKQSDPKLTSSAGKQVADWVARERRDREKADELEFTAE